MEDGRRTPHPGRFHGRRYVTRYKDEKYPLRLGGVAEVERRVGLLNL